MYIGAMKATLLAGLLALTTIGCSKSDNPQPAAPTSPTPSALYTDAAGAQHTLSGITALSVTTTPSSYGSRRAIVIYVPLPTREVVTLTYRYVGTGFGDPGAVLLDEAPQVDVNQPATRYQAAGITTGTLTIDSGDPKVVSATYAGPLAAGRPAVRFTLSRLPIQP